MKGDFSRVHAPHHNFNGILPQQGKVLLDSDGIAQTLIENNWRETAVRDMMGAAAAVPSNTPNAFAVTAASLSGGVVTLTVGTGHLWADGLLVRLGPETSPTVTRTATWLEPPLVATEGSAGDVAAGVHDAVFLEVWQRAVNGYEMPEALIEPALGGPDTAERLQTACAFRLARLNAGQTCADVKFDESNRGAISVSLVPPVVTSGDCPVEGSGGYSGFEHRLYRIEIADTNAGGAQFKWSRTNGGLVGRGIFDSATQKISITANLAAITSANRPGFYLEMEAYDPALGYSRVIAGAQAMLAAGSLQCPASPAFGAYPSTTGSIFFRLWDGISPVSAFPVSATPAQLEDGILLQFDADGPGKYFAGDYWMFPVRAGIPNPQILIDKKQPQGIVYHRVPLAEITWATSGPGFSGSTEDCRTVVPPLSRNKGCCTFRVGDGIHSFGDFTSIQAAVDALPPEGGEVCILPGRYFEYVRIVNRRDVVIHGCGWQTRIASPRVIIESKPNAAPPVNSIAAVISVVASEHIQLRSFAVEAADTDAGILLDGTGTTVAAGGVKLKQAAAAPSRLVIDVLIENTIVLAATLPAILAQTVEALRIERNRILMKNVASLWPAVFVSGREIHIERNLVGVLTAASAAEYLPVTVIDDETGGSNTNAAAQPLSAIVRPVHPGGIQIGGASTDVYILENEIEGGSRNGITLGSYLILDAKGADTLQWTGVLVAGDAGDCCPGTLDPPGNPPGDPGGSIVAAGILTNIQIHRNRIRNMGLCGIGPVAFFNLATALEVISIVGLNISHNSITGTVVREVTAVRGAIAGYAGISVPDVLNLIVRDNVITDFGAQPGASACGIFVLHGELLEIGRNQVLETRDWNNPSAAPQTAGGSRGGIVIALATPPSFAQPQSGANALAIPVYQPGLPAVRIEENVVRVPLNYALELVGIGPFHIADNHFSCGGLVVVKEARALAQTVLIGDFGAGIDGGAARGLPSNVFAGSQKAYSGNLSAVQTPESGMVVFTGNQCQLNATASNQTEYTSVLIFSSDSLIFSNNHCWLAGQRSGALADAMLGAFSLNVVGNRFQEAPNSVTVSGITAGTINITAQNISTYCLLASGSMLSDNNNIALIQASNRDLCASLAKELQGLGL